MTETYIGTRIREVRRARGLTQQQLAQQVDISVRMLRAYEQNKRVPDDKTLHRIADVLEFPAHPQSYAASYCRVCVCSVRKHAMYARRCSLAAQAAVAKSCVRDALRKSVSQPAS